MIQTSHAQQLTSERTKLIAEAVQEESRSTVTVLTAAHSDSQVMKTLTFVAMFYLPASLVAVGLTRPPRVLGGSRIV